MDAKVRANVRKKLQKMANQETEDKEGKIKRQGSIKVKEKLEEDVSRKLVKKIKKVKLENITEEEELELKAMLKMVKKEQEKIDGLLKDMDEGKEIDFEKEYPAEKVEEVEVKSQVAEETPSEKQEEESKDVDE